MTEEASLLVSFLPIILTGVFFAIPTILLAKEKGRNPWKWAILCLIPLVNFFAIPYFIGTPSSKLEEKVDRLLEQRGLNPGGK